MSSSTTSKVGSMQEKQTIDQTQAQSLYQSCYKNLMVNKIRSNDQLIKGI